MNQYKEILLIGGSGAIGSYTAAELARLGYHVDVITLENLSSSAQITYLTAPANDEMLLQVFRQKKYDAIVDFLHYNPKNYSTRLKLLAEHTDHLIFLSSYRVYADEEHPIRETSPQLWDITEDKTHFEETNSYSAFKSQCEQLIRQSPYVNKVTIVRPLIAFYHGRLSFITKIGRAHV